MEREREREPSPGTNYSASNPYHVELKNLYKPVTLGMNQALQLLKGRLVSSKSVM